MSSFEISKSILDEIIDSIETERIEHREHNDEEIIIKKKKSKQSDGLSERHKQMAIEGRHLTDDSIVSEKTLNEAIKEILVYASEKAIKAGGEIKYKKTISLYECQEYFHASGGPPPNPENKSFSMKPDGGIIIFKKNNIEYPILISEDKVQGTNDILHENGKKRQATGNAIERGAKNIRGAEMIFSNMDIFPYVLFASGCDFHSSETIAKRIEMMNMGKPNNKIEINPTTTDNEIKVELDKIIDSIDIRKVKGISLASVFVKTHKWNEMPHGSSAWKREEIVKICKKVIDQSFQSIL
jgi:hypothetical protein